MSAATATMNKPNKAAKATIQAAKAAAIEAATAPEQLVRAVTDIQKAMQTVEETNIKEWYDIGKRFNEIIADDSGIYGSDPKKYILSVAQVGRDSIRPMMEMAAAYDDVELESLLAFRHPVTNEGLTKSHLVVLSRVKDKKKAFAMAQDAATKGWSTKELSRAVISSSGGPKSKGGRPRKKFETFAAAMQNVIDLTNNLLSAYDKVWSSADDGLAATYLAMKFGLARTPTQADMDQCDLAESNADALATKLRDVSLTISNIKLKMNAAMKKKE